MASVKALQTLNHNGKTYKRGEVIKDLADHDVKAFLETGYVSEVKEAKEETETKAKTGAPENKGK